MAKGDRDDLAGDERRHTDRRLDRIEQDVRDMTAAHNEERTLLHEDLATQRSRLEGHELACGERWKANDNKWAENTKKIEGTDFKLNAIIGTSFATLLTVCGFFIALWIDRQNERAAHRDEVAHSGVVFRQSQR
jgi:hypothetical protein